VKEETEAKAEEEMKEEDKKEEVKEKKKEETKTWGEKLFHDFEIWYFPDWFKFVGDGIDKFIPFPPQIEIAKAGSEVIMKNKGKIIDLGKKYIDVKLESATLALDKELRGLHTAAAAGGGFTYEDCVF